MHLKEKKCNTLLNYRTDLYFHKYKLAIEVDGLGHNDRTVMKHKDKEY